LAAGKVALASNFYAFVVSGALSGIATAGAAVVILRTGVFPRWVGWAGASIAVAIVGSAAIVENDRAGIFAAVNGLAWLAYFVWIAAVAVSLAVAGRATPKTSP
jgi:hypothetical protein